MHELKRETINTSDLAAEFILTCKTEKLASLTGQEIAETLGLDLSYLLETFEAKQCIELDQFINREKVHRSIFILDEDREISIDDLARKLGFRETQQFARDFENYLLINPQRYQEIIQHGQIRNSKPRSVMTQIEFQIEKEIKIVMENCGLFTKSKVISAG
jgi:AraC-like DNA-binding protein